MENLVKDLIAEIQAYCEARSMAPGTFGSYAMNDGKFLRRIERTGQCLPSTAAKARAYMAAHPAAEHPMRRKRADTA